MKEIITFDVDNSADGNCMYYAYSISLMYCIKGQLNSMEFAKPIFKKQNLSVDDEKNLNDLLSKGIAYEYSTEDITKIETILGPAVRNLAADQTVKEFISNPTASYLFSVAAYKFREKIRSHLPNLVETYTNDGGNYSNSHFYKIDGIEKMMERFISRNIHDIKRSYIERIFASQEIYDGMQAKMFQTISTNVLDNVISEYLVKFFINNNNSVLNKVAEKLNQTGTWGSEETLFTLHRAVTGEYTSWSNSIVPPPSRPQIYLIKKLISSIIKI